MIETGMMPEKKSAADIYSVQYHGFSVTHLDALCHVFYSDKMYNGFSKKEVTDKGAGKLSVINIKNGIFTRGVLMDLPRLFGVEYLKGRRAIYPEDLDAWEKKAGIKVQSGDVILIRTGRWARYKAEGEWDALKDSSGLDASCTPWLKKRDIAVLGSDLASDVMPSGVEGTEPDFLPVHLITIVAMGAPILDNCDLEALSEAAAARGRWTFLLTVGPLAVEGGTGSPVNPIATF
jgi:kynurenine formamidase